MRLRFFRDSVESLPRARVCETKGSDPVGGLNLGLFWAECRRPGDAGDLGGWRLCPEPPFSAFFQVGWDGLSFSTTDSR